LGTDTVAIRDLRHAAQGSDMRVQLALQGPRSRDILLALLEEDDPLRETLLEMSRNRMVHGHLAGHDLHISRTGYTGEPVGFEIFVHPAAAPALWHSLLEAGSSFGLKPAGLDARDSLRTEAGLPKYGHELAGPLGLNPADAGFSTYVKLYKPFFIGKKAYMVHEQERGSRLIRFRFDEEHARVPSLGDVIVSRQGRVVGTVTSCSLDSDGGLTGLAFVQAQHAKRGTHLGVFQSATQAWTSKQLTDLRIGDQVQLHDTITVIRRFLNKTE
jgi:glycine hydroxymethyltransferase